MTEFPGSEHQMERIVVEVPSHSAEELTAILGEFALNHGGSVKISGRADLSEVAQEISASIEPILVNDADINPEYVLWDNDAAGNKSPLVTSDMLKNFAHDKGLKSPTVIRACQAFFINYRSRPYVETNVELLEHERFLVTGINHGLGLDARKLPELTYLLRRGRMDLWMVGKMAMDLLEQYSESMLQDSRHQDESLNADITET